MSTYTVSISDLLLQGNTEGKLLHPSNPSYGSDVEAIALRTIFPGTSVEAIDPAYRSAFVQGFVGTFMMDEIGVETVSLWQTLLWHKLTTYAPFIDEVFSKASEGLFGDLATTDSEASDTASGATTSSEVGNRTGNESGTRNDTESGTSKDTETGSRQDSSNTSDDVTGQTNSSQRETGSGDVTSEGTSSTGVTQSDGANQISKFSNTPQQGLSGVLAGNYLTSATVNEGDNTSESTTNGATGDAQHTERDFTTGVEGTAQENRTGSASSLGNDERERNGEDARTREGLDSREHTEDDTREVVGSDERTAESSSSVRTVTIGYDQLMSMQPLLHKVWAVFDDLFLSLL